MSAGLWKRLNFSLRNRESKQTELSAFRSKLNRRTTVWPAVHNILFQHWLHLKQTLSRSIHLSQRERNLRKSVDLNSINKSSLSHCYFPDRCFHQVLGKLKSFHSLATCVGVVSRTESKLWECVELGGKEGQKATDHLVIKEQSNQWLLLLQIYTSDYLHF